MSFCRRSCSVACTYDALPRGVVSGLLTSLYNLFITAPSPPVCYNCTLSAAQTHKRSRTEGYIFSALRFASQTSRRRSSSQRHEEIWSWSVETPSWQTALAGCAWESHLQARPYDVPLFARTSTLVPRRSYQASHWSCIATSTTFCQPTPANRTPLSTQHVRTSGFSSCGTCCQMNSEIQRVTLTVSNSSLKQSCSVSTSVTSALEVNFNNMRYINLHFTYPLYFIWYLYVIQHLVVPVRAPRWSQASILISHYTHPLPLHVPPCYITAPWATLKVIFLLMKTLN